MSYIYASVPLGLQEANDNDEFVRDNDDDDCEVNGDTYEICMLLLFLVFVRH